MLDFVHVTTKIGVNKVTEIYPKFIISKSKDIMFRGSDFYCCWDEENGLWTTDEFRCIQMIDEELKDYTEAHKGAWESYRTLYLWDADSGSIDKFHKYCQKQSKDNFHTLDEKLIFQNDPVNKKDYASKRLSYPLQEGDYSAWDKLIGTLYSPEERHKIEWAIGSIVNGDSKTIQKFIVFYGAAGAGKSTILNIIEELFDGYCAAFDAKALGAVNNSFALEQFRSNPLVALQHDGDLSTIADNTKLNSLVSHETMTINEKFKSTYQNSFKAFLFMATNKPVRITDAKSGLIRRLIDVTPSGNKLTKSEYNKCMAAIKFELGAIAWHCKEVYEENPGYYDSYIPTEMLGSTNDFYNFVETESDKLDREDGISLTSAYALYKVYCEDALVPYPLSRRAFKEELKNYYDIYEERHIADDGTRLRSWYKGFALDKFDTPEPKKSPDEKSDIPSWLDLKEQDSLLDVALADMPAQLTNDNETPKYKWDNVKTKLKDIDTHKLHYVLASETHIFIDFDLKNDKGEKDYKLNLEAASKWPKTYAELSKGGEGIHLHYIYGGDPNRLSRIFAKDVEVKTCTGKNAIRRRLSKCNDIPIAHINSGLPLKEEKKKVIDFNGVITEKGMRNAIVKALNKEVHDSTKCNIDFIFKVLDDAYKSDFKYDLSDMKQAVLTLAMHSTHQKDYCLNKLMEMHFASEDPSENAGDAPGDLYFYDVEVFPNLFLVNYKKAGKDNPVVRLINPKPEDIELILNRKLIGFNCRDYDNHIMYARMMGYSNEQLYKLSSRLINGDKEETRHAKFGEAFGLSYTDVYDFASAGNKMSLKKWEIKLRRISRNPNSKISDELREMISHIKHHELGLPWDEPVPEELWPKVAEYCDDDVLATEALFYYLESDFTARQILADLAGMTVNDKTNDLTGRIIFDKDKHPQDEFNWRDLSKPVMDLTEQEYNFLANACPEMMEQTHGEAGSLLPYFPGYEFKDGKSYYRGELVGEGGFAQGFPGIYGDVALLDISSMHPHSTIAEILFGVKYTTAYRDIVEGRVSIKHKAWDEVDNMLNGKLKPYIQKVKDGEMSAKSLANALKTAINSVYGLTSAKFPNLFKDPRNVDNIVAKRGALFMIDLKHAVEEKGYKVVHIKTDSIKIADSDPGIIEFVMNFGKKYGYTFEHEATYDKICLVNDAVYIAKFATKEKCELLYGIGNVPDENLEAGGEWTATGTQFQIPYVFKTLFSKEAIEFEDMCETKSVTTSLYLDKNEGLPDVTAEEKELKALESKYKKGLLSDTTFEAESKRLMDVIEKGHNYIFVGRVGEFTPIKPGYGGAELVAKRGDKKYSSVTGAKGYRWLESDMVEELGKTDDIDISYYRKMVDDACDTINKYTTDSLTLNWFCSDEEYETLPFH